MKKFHFSLDSVKNYKDLELEELKRLHGLMLTAIAQKESEIQGLEAECVRDVHEFNEKKQTGVTVIEAQSFDAHIRRLQRAIEREYMALEELEKEEIARRDKMVLKKQEISSIEKLREKRVIEYNKAVQKEEETFIEEIVVNRRIAAG